MAGVLLAILLIAAPPSSAHPVGSVAQLSIATSDPFASAEALPRPNRVMVFGGGYTFNRMGDSFIWNLPRLSSDYLAGVAFSRDFVEMPMGFGLGGEIGAAGRFGRRSDPSLEVWGAVKLGHHGLVVGDINIAPAVYLGLSAVTGRLEIEAVRERLRGGTSTLLVYFSPEIAVRTSWNPDLEVFYRLHHRSGAFGLFGGMSEGANANTFGIRWRF